MADEITIKFHVPEVWLGRHWDEYLKAQEAYRRVHPTDGNVLRADYAGSVALIKANYVPVEGPDIVKAWLDTDPADLPLAFIGLVRREVGLKLEAALSGPLPLTATL